MRAIRALVLLFIPIAVAAHPGGGLIALDANTVIFGDSMYNSVWRLEKGKKAQALVTNFHAHWTTRGLDGQIYSESNRTEDLELNRRTSDLEYCDRRA